MSDCVTVLKTDDITVTLTERIIAPKLSTEPKVVVLTPLQPSEWNLPTLDEGLPGLASVKVQLPENLKSVIDFDQDSRVFRFKGLSSNSSLADKKFLYKLELTSVSEALETVVYNLMVQILPFGEEPIVEKTVISEEASQIVRPVP